MDFEIGFQNGQLKVSKHWPVHPQFLKISEFICSDVLPDTEIVKDGYTYFFMVDTDLMCRVCDQLRSHDGPWRDSDLFARLGIISIPHAFNVLKRSGSAAIPLIESFLTHESFPIASVASYTLFKMGWSPPAGRSPSEVIPLPCVDYEHCSMDHGPLPFCVTLPSGFSKWQCSTCIRYVHNLRSCFECGLYCCRSCSFWCTLCPKNLANKYTICGSCASTDRYLVRRRRTWICENCRLVAW